MSPTSSPAGPGSPTGSTNRLSTSSTVGVGIGRPRGNRALPRRLRVGQDDDLGPGIRVLGHRRRLGVGDGRLRHHWIRDRDRLGLDDRLRDHDGLGTRDRRCGFCSDRLRLRRGLGRLRLRLDGLAAPRASLAGSWPPSPTPRLPPRPRPPPRGSADAARRPASTASPRSARACRAARSARSGPAAARPRPRAATVRSRPAAAAGSVSRSFARSPACSRATARSTSITASQGGTDSG